MRSFTALLLSLLASSASADDLGFLLVERYPGAEERPGAVPARMLVYDAAGAIVPGNLPDGAFSAGTYAEVPEGWYFVDVGSVSAPAAVRKVYVDEGRVTVVPTAWVRVVTVDPAQQPTEGCSKWIATLTASAQLPDGSAAAIASNLTAAPVSEGAIQVPATSLTVFFRQFPIVVAPEEDTLVELPTGFLLPTVGERQRITHTDPADPTIAKLGLCEDGAMHLPVGEYFISSDSSSPENPWYRVTVTSEQPPAVDELSAARLEHERYEGPGSEPALPGEADAAALAAILAAPTVRSRLPLRLPGR